MHLLKSATNLFVKQMPKLELHAHLTGSIPRHRLVGLLKDQGFEKESQIVQNAKIDLTDFCAAFFSNSSLAIKNKQGLRKLTNIVVETFIEDNVVYLQIRTTPRSGVDYSIVDYYNTIIEECSKYKEYIRVKLIVSMNRGVKDFNVYSNIVEDILKVKDWKHNIVALDFSGDPQMRTFTEFIPIFTRARQHGLKLTIHTGEVQSQINETQQILSTKPERIGHLNFYEPKHLKHIKQNNIVIQVCISSNVQTKPLENIHAHQVKQFVEYNIKHCICSDDILLFDSTVSQEYQKYQQIFNCTNQHLYRLNKNTIQYAFDQSQLQFIKNKFEQFQKTQIYQNLL